jgi:glyoxylase-like metal-dependent hydrolase (beta-lactamase superfamily II)
MKIHEIKGYIQSIYLIEYPNKLLAFDSGCRCDVKVVKKFIEQDLKRPFSDLKLVAISHAHPDHSGGGHIFQKKYHIPLAANPTMNYWYSGLQGNIVYWVDLFLTYFIAFRKKYSLKKNLIFKTKLNIDHPIQDQSSLPGFEDWKCIRADGHTSSDLSFYHAKSKTCYVGDNLVKARTKIYRPYPINYPKLYKQTLHRYLNLDIENYLLAHSGSQQIESGFIQQLMDETSLTPRNHRVLATKILKNKFKKLISK